MDEAKEKQRLTITMVGTEEDLVKVRERISELPIVVWSAHGSPVKG